MKLNYVKYTSIVLLGVGVCFISCKKSFLETTPKGEFLEANYYQTHQGGFNFATNSITDTAGKLGTAYNDVKGQALFTSLVMTW